MTDATPTPAYLSALSSYLRGAEESALLWAYEYGREALERGGGVLDLGVVHRDAVATLLEDAADGAEAARISREAWTFLDEQVRERTRDLDESLEELRRADEGRRLLLERLVSAQEDERRRIAGDIHDDSIQVITAAYLRVELIRQALGDDPRSDSLAKLDEALRASIERLRHMIFELRPAMLDTAGLSATIQEHLDQWRRQTGATYTLSTRLEREPAPLVRITLYRIAAEALANVRKHARATHVSVELVQEPRGFLLRIADDGVGLGSGRKTAPSDHFGVSMMTERASMAGGWCRVESNEPEPGTTVVVWTPHSRTEGVGRPAEHERGAGDAADSRIDR
jgi:signal transduction histidine kinase